MTVDPMTCLTLALGCLAIVPILGAIVCSGYVYQVQKAQIRLLQEQKDDLARRLKETQQAANIPTVFLVGFEPPTMLPETLADLEQLTERLAQIQAIPSLPLLPTVRFPAEEYFSLATGYYQLKNYDKALEQLNKALELDPHFEPAYYSNRAAVYRHLEQLEPAMQDLDRALKMKPDYANAYFNQACIYSLVDRPDDAVSSLEKAITLDPKHRQDAKTDPDFDNIRDDPHFRALVYGDEEPS